MFEDPTQVARQEKFLRELSESERAAFDEARRAGLSFGQAELCLLNRRRRAAKSARAAACKPTARRATALSSSSAPASRRIPAAACLLRAGPFLLAGASGASRPSGKQATSARILARSGQAIEHWYWGRLVHDFAGMETVKDRLPLDYCHDQGEILGYAENWDRRSGDLTCKAVLLADQSERAAEVVALAKSGVPYEASISFTPITVEELQPGKTATINGQLVTGPASVIRRWRLTGLAVCPRGADPHTKAELSARGEVEVSLVR